MPNKKRKHLLHFTFIAAGILCAGLGIKGFLLPSHFIDGGITGIAMLLAETLHWPLFLLIPLMNLPFLVVGYFHMGRLFTLKSVLAILGLACALFCIHFPVVTQDRLLTAVFGGLFVGAGIGLAIRGGAVLDGTEIAALLISKLSPTLKVGDVILAFNLLVFSVAAFVLGIEPALYSMLTYMAASKMMNFLIHGLEEYTAVLIISSQHEVIRQALIQDLKRSITLLKGAGGMSGTPKDILYCVVTKLEIGKIKSVVQELDPNAFVVVHALADAEGGRVKKRL